MRKGGLTYSRAMLAEGGPGGGSPLVTAKRRQPLLPPLIAFAIDGHDNHMHMQCEFEFDVDFII